MKKKKKELVTPVGSLISLAECLFFLKKAPDFDFTGTDYSN